MKKIKLSAGIILLVQILFCRVSFSAQMSVYYVNVGQGDAQYIELPNGKNIIIDGGRNSFINTTNPVIAFLESRNVTNINYMIATHPDGDHINGLTAVLKKYRVENVYDPKYNKSSNYYDAFKSAVAIEGSNYIQSKTGDIYEWDSSVVIKCLNARTDVSEPNNASIVLKITFSSSTFLFTGDAETDDTENNMVQNYGDELRSDILKVGHHGSRYSSATTFLNKVEPEYAMIGVGPNSYGHPTQETISRLNSAGVKRIFYTGYNPNGSPDGTIRVTTTGDGIYTITTNYETLITQPEQPGQPGQPDQTLNSTYIVLFNNLFHPDRQEWTEFQYYISQAGKMDVKIFTLDGEMVKQYERYDANSGTYFWAWDGKNRDEDTVAAGVYILKIKTADAETTKKAILIR
ncbi:MAG: MBL fold metallo-hydrolase [Elusimicrobiota bacterium]